MKKYLMRRSITGILTIFIALFITFYLTRLAPGNPIQLMAGRENVNPNQIEKLNEKYGFNRPLLVQFVDYMGEILKGNLGNSIRTNRPVFEMIMEKIPNTLILTFSSTILSVITGTFIGLYAARNEGSLFDKIFTKISYIIDSLPIFWLGLVLIVIFATRLNILPTGGMYSIRESYEGLDKLFDLLKHIILPILTIVIINIPYYFRLSKASALSVMKEDFIRTLMASGMDEKKIFNKYILKNAIIPIVAALSMSMASLIGGVALIEIVFSWLGMGRVMMDAIFSQDYPVISGLYLMISFSVVIWMLITDIIYVYLDPRMKLE